MTPEILASIRKQIDLGEERLQVARKDIEDLKRAGGDTSTLEKRLAEHAQGLIRLKQVYGARK